jgi:hypothetical protein
MKKNYNSYLNDLLSDIQLPSDEEIKESTKSEKIKLALKNTIKKDAMIKGNKKGGNTAKKSGQLAEACKKGGEAVRDSGKLAEIRALPRDLPYTTTPIIATNKKTGKETEFESQHAAARKLSKKDCKVYVNNINHCLSGKRNSTGGFTFRYKK